MGFPEREKQSCSEVGGAWNLAKCRTKLTLESELLREKKLEVTF